MAIRPNNEYPGATTSPDADYPYGGARNVSSPGDDTGTPWEEKLINDLFGFQQALLKEANITPNDNPETAVASQYLDGLKAVFAEIDLDETITGAWDFTGGPKLNGTPLDTMATESAADYELKSNLGGMAYESTSDYGALADQNDWGSRQDFNGGVSVGGATIQSIESTTASVSSNSLGAHATHVFGDYTVSGAEKGDNVIVDFDSDNLTAVQELLFNGRVDGADNVRAWVTNTRDGSETQPSGRIRITVIRF